MTITIKELIQAELERVPEEQLEEVYRIIKDFNEKVNEESSENPRLDKDWGLTDCTSLVVMKQRRLKEALTFSASNIVARSRSLRLP